MNPDKTNADYMLDLTACASELKDIFEKFKSIEMDAFDNHNSLLKLNNRFAGACKKLGETINFAAANKKSKPEVSIKLNDALVYIDVILIEKSRILNNTPQIFKEMNDMSWMN